jgi:hypothetical protein
MDKTQRFPGTAARLVGLAALIFVTAVGCGGTTKVNVSGTVKYKGEPVRSGTIRMIGPNNSGSNAIIQPDGSFTLTDVVPGDVKVAIIEGPPPPSKGEAKVVLLPLPDKVRDPEKSGLQYTITSETRSLEIVIPDTK